MKNIETKICKGIALTCLLLSSNYVFAAAPFQQKIILKTKVAHLDNNVPFKAECLTCIKTIKQDDYTYFIQYTAPSQYIEGKATFVYYYGDNKESCIYNAKINFGIHPNGRFFAEMNYPSELATSSTSKACPPVVALFAQTQADVTTLNIDW